MKKSKVYVKALFLISAAVIILFSLESCAIRSKFLPSNIVPMAQGIVKVQKNRNKRYIINIAVSNLAEPTHLATPKNTYVVWMLSVNAETQNLGQLTINPQTLTGAFKVLTGVRPSKIYITSEDNLMVLIPSGTKAILETANF